ncbi:transcriptional regulator, TetR family [Roseovarius nanhaiticus]|uniref:Transcriptional regulator, TetR family n=1 Tax=Roseovarius nanhaiticus TaxID=573024 RepID=A0A1N7H616_9RHOB|nr:TetR/AcrR family transcriptional regulator [Roseovarius nanhaiticus]SEL11979.1 transcriptional regulator, TetR family [Roseovarius nanhaiticus]SIS20150.1 transcriptional regulator, TetR family [Roseovarius nanhaiticus]
MEMDGAASRGAGHRRAAGSAPRRRTQAERSAATQQKILDVTTDLILSKGLRDTSTVDVAEAAGVSRGALLHHYPSRQILMQEALRHLLNREIAEITVIAAAIRAGDMDVDGFLTEMWRRFSGPLFMVTIEFLTAARTDPAMRDALVPVATDYNHQLDEIWENLFPDAAHIRGTRRIALNTTLCLLRGMATQSIWRDDPKLFQEMLEFWKTSLGNMLPGPDEGTPR